MRKILFILLTSILLNGCNSLLTHIHPISPQKGINSDIQIAGTRQNEISLGTHQQLRDAQIAIASAEQAVGKAETAIARQETANKIVHNEHEWWYYVILGIFFILISLLVPSIPTWIRIFKIYK